MALRQAFWGQARDRNMYRTLAEERTEHHSDTRYLSGKDNAWNIMRIHINTFAISVIRA